MREMTQGAWHSWAERMERGLGEEVEVLRGDRIEEVLETLVEFPSCELALFDREGERGLEIGAGVRNDVGVLEVRGEAGRLALPGCDPLTREIVERLVEGSGIAVLRRR